MEHGADRDSDRDPRQDFPIVVANMPATKRQRRLALTVVLALAVSAAAVAPFARVQLGRVDAFIPVLQTVLCVADLVTAVLLFAQYSIQPRRAILALGSGYIFAGLFAFLQTLAFPGGYAPLGLIGDAINSAGWFFFLWHTTFPLGVLVYALTKDAGVSAPSPGRSTAATIALTVAGVVVATAALAWLATAGSAYLPSLYAGNVLQQTPLANHINAFMWLWGTTALVVLFVRRRTILDLWLMVTLFAWMPNFVAAALLTVVRFSFAWYVSRGYALIASCTVLTVLLTETTLLYSRLASAILLQRRERAGRLMSVEAATGAVAHEIKQPLSAIVANHEAALMWLQRTPPDLKAASRCMDAIGASAERADEIISDIRELFKKSASRRSLVQVDDVARQVLDLVRHDLQVNQVSVNATFHGSLPRVSADPGQLQQVILNVVRNAIDAMASTAPGARRLRVATGLGADSDVVISIADTGPGLGADDRRRIFDPFFTTKPGGMGLGLSISRTIVEGHGGDLRVRKSDAHGTTFEIALPMEAAQFASG